MISDPTPLESNLFATSRSHRAPLVANTSQRTAGDRRFYERCGPFSVAKIAASVGGNTIGVECQISGLAPLHAACATDVSFINGRRYLSVLSGSRIDNLVQIGHNVKIGRCCVIVAQVGIAGSTVLEDFVQIGGQAASASHLHIGTGVQIGAQAGLIADAPAQPRQEFFRQIVTLKRITRKSRSTKSAVAS